MAYATQSRPVPRGAHATKSRPRAGILLAILALLCATGGHAEIPEPDHFFYGRSTLNGVPVAAGTEIKAVIGGVVVDTFVVGDQPELGDNYRLRVPIDAVDPLPENQRVGRPPGTARVGDVARFFINTDGVTDQLAGRAVVSERGAVTRLDLDPAAIGTDQLSIADVTLFEGNAGNTDALFTVTLSDPLNMDLDIDFATADGTATTGGNDYLETQGTLTIPAGETSGSIAVPVVGDTRPESDETFTVQLTLSPAAMSLVDLVDGQAVGTIRDEDSAPGISISDLSIEESESAIVKAVFTVSLTHVWHLNIRFDVATAPGTATPGEDYSPLARTDAVLAGELTRQIRVDVLPDVLDEEDETFALVISNPRRGRIIDGEGIATIIDSRTFLVFEERQKDGDGADALDGVIGSAVSADGANVYAASFGEDALTVFSRDALTGHLTEVQSLRDGAGGIDGLGGAVAVELSADDQNVYVAGFLDDRIAVFERSPGGGLVFLQSVVDDSGGVNGLDGATAIAVSPAGAAGDHVYVAGARDDAIAIFERDPTGQLTFLEAVVNGTGGVVKLLQPSSLALSPDGKSLYVTSLVGESILLFERAADGTLALKQRLSDVAGLSGPKGVTVGPAGEYVYVAAANDNAIGVFRRETSMSAGTLGELALVEVVSEGDLQGSKVVTGLEGACSLVVGPRGDALYVAAQLQPNPALPEILGALSAFRRDPATGTLEYIETKFDDMGTIDGLWNATSVEVSPDDLHVYATGFLDDAVAVFARDLLAPENPTLLESTSHQINVWNNNPTIRVQWSGARDVGRAGLAGYAYRFGRWPLADPGTTIVQAHTTDPHSTEDTVAPDGAWTFHLRTCDQKGNCAEPVHLGPFRIDTRPPTDPTVIERINAIGADTIRMRFAGASDVRSGVGGYWYGFNQKAVQNCRQILRLPAMATEVESPALGPGDWWFHMCTVDVAGNWSVGRSVGPFLAGDVVPPLIDLVETVAGTPDGFLDDGEVVFGGPTQVLVGFTEELGSGFDDPASYLLLDAGRDESFSTFACGPLAGDDLQVAIDAATTPATTDLVALRLNGGRPLTEGIYRLIVCGAALEDTAGNQLDGDDDGTEGGDFVSDFGVAKSNLLLNPNLDSDLSSWVSDPPSVPDIAFDPEDEQEAFSSGSLRIMNVGGAAEYFIAQCVDFRPAADVFTLASRVRIETNSPVADDPAAFGEVWLFAASGCDDVRRPPPGVPPIVLIEVSDDPLNPNPDWRDLVSGPIDVPEVTRSALVIFGVSVDDPGVDFTIHFDDLFWGSTMENIFTDGFESGDTSSWTSVP